jgi:hypothetical protein
MAPAFTLHQRIKEPEREISPGPSDYQPVDVSKLGRIKTGFVKPWDLMPAFDDDVGTGPGPGAYDVAVNFGADARGVELRGLPPEGQRDVKRVDYRMAYDIPRLFDKPTAVRSIHPHVGDVVKIPEGPSPDSYIMPDRWAKLKVPTKGKKRPLKKIGARVSQYIEYNDNPGPGRYDTPSTIGRDGPAFTLGWGAPSPWSKARDMPGPGAYVPEASTMKERSPRFTISPKYELKSRDVATQDAPYYLLPDDHGKGWTIRRREELDLIAE